MPETVLRLSMLHSLWREEWSFNRGRRKNEEASVNRVRMFWCNKCRIILASNQNDYMDNVIKTIEKWYKAQCDAEWEHEYGVVIASTDNPGWHVTIDLAETELDGLSLELESCEDDTGWWLRKVHDGQYVTAGDPHKLELILTKFVEWKNDIDRCVN